MIRLPFEIIEGNMGAQYHHYLLGIILQNERNWGFVYNNYMGMLVKHLYDSHGDFAFDGIYSVSSEIIKRMIVRGPVQNIKELIIESLQNGCYVVLNVNEMMLKDRQAYQNHYFRHDLLIYGYDREKDLFVTAGFNEDMVFSECVYESKMIEQAYFTLQSEWDYEVFLLKYNDDFRCEVDYDRIFKQIKAYIRKENNNLIDIESFYMDRADMYYMNNSYEDFYGLGIYDFLIKRIKGERFSLFGGKRSQTVGINELRTVNALMYHKKIIYKFVNNNKENLKMEEEIEAFLLRLDNHIKRIYGLNLLLLRYMDSENPKYKMKLIKELRRIRDEEEQLLSVIVQENL